MKDFLIGCSQFLAGAFVGCGIIYGFSEYAPEFLSKGWFISTFAVPIVITNLVNGPARLLFTFWGIFIGGIFAWSLLSHWFKGIGNSIRGLSVDELALIPAYIAAFSAFGAFIVSVVKLLKGTTNSVVKYSDYAA